MKVKNFEKYLKSRLNKNEIAELKRQAKIESFDSWDEVSKELFSENELKKLKADAQKRSNIRNQISHDDLSLKLTSKIHE